MKNRNPYLMHQRKKSKVIIQITESSNQDKTDTRLPQDMCFSISQYIHFRGASVGRNFAKLVVGMFMIHRLRNWIQFIERPNYHIFLGSLCSPAWTECLNNFIIIHASNLSLLLLVLQWVNGNNYIILSKAYSNPWGRIRSVVLCMRTEWVLVW